MSESKENENNTHLQVRYRYALAAEVSNGESRPALAGMDGLPDTKGIIVMGEWLELCSWCIRRSAKILIVWAVS
jgi:hypothetical protein